MLGPFSKFPRAVPSMWIGGLHVRKLVAHWEQIPWTICKIKEKKRKSELIYKPVCMYVKTISSSDSKACFVLFLTTLVCTKQKNVAIKHHTYTEQRYTKYFFRCRQTGKRHHDWVIHAPGHSDKSWLAGWCRFSLRVHLGMCVRGSKPRRQHWSLTFQKNQLRDKYIPLRAHKPNEDFLNLIRTLITLHKLSKHIDVTSYECFFQLLSWEDR